MFKFQREAEARQCVPVSVVLQNSMCEAVKMELVLRYWKRKKPWDNYKEKLKSLNIEGTKQHICVTLLTLER